MRGRFWRLIGIIALAMIARPAWTQPPKEARPNIVVIVSDDHGTDAIGTYGNPVIRTPNLDALAAAGIRFDRGYATTASCSPSRSVLLSGLHNHANGMYGLQHGWQHFSSLDNVKSLPLMLAKKGYRTARIGKYHLGPESVYKFDVVLADGKANDPDSFARSPVEMADMTRDFIRPSGTPFMLYFATDDPHRAVPYDIAPKPNSFGNRPQGYPGVTEVTYRPEDVPVPWFLPNLPETRQELAQYYQSVSRLDQGVGRLIDLLKASGQYENTLIIYLSDNGIAFAGAKTTMYEPGIRLPLIVKLPGEARAGTSTDALVSWTDITPTILDYAGGVPTDANFHGASIRPVLEGAPDVPGRDAVFGSHTFHEVQMYYPMRAIITHRFKLIHNLAYPLTYPSALDLVRASSYVAFLKSGKRNYGPRSLQAYLHRPEYELFDLVADPHEAHNLASDAKHRSTLQQLRARLEAFMRETGDPWRVKLEYE